MISGFDYLPHCPHGVNTSRQPCLDCANGIGRSDGWAPNFNPKTAAPSSASFDPSRWSAGGGGYAADTSTAVQSGGRLNLNGRPPELMQPSPVVNALLVIFLMSLTLGLGLFVFKVLPMMYKATVHSYARRLHTREAITLDEALARTQADVRQIVLPTVLAVILAIYFFTIVL